MLAKIINRRASRTHVQPLATPAALAFRQALPWLLASLSMTMLALLEQVPSWALMVFGACTLWRYVLARRGGPLPSMLVRILLFLPVATCVVMTYGTNPSATGMLTLLIALISLKILELRSGRDFTIVALLGYFMVLSAFFYDQSLGLSLYLCVSLLLNTVALIRCHSGGRREVGPALRLALGMTAQTIPLVLLLFVIFPRIQGHFLHRFGGSTAGVMGMSEHLQPGSFSSLAGSDDPAFRVQIENGVMLPQTQLYWRGLVLDVCDASMTWSAGKQIQRTNGGVPKPSAGSHRIKQLITQYSQGERWLFALDRPVGILSPSSIDAVLTDSDVLQSTKPEIANIVYHAVSETNPAPPERDVAAAQEFLSLPPDVSEKVRTLAKSWRPAGRSDEEVIHAALQFFRTGGFSYTLHPDLLPTHNALDAFIFQSRRGFCEHYAAAFSTMMRVAGLPARIVVGYQGGEFNSAWGRYYLIRQSDAHAWSEVYVKGKGWQREDPTAVVAPERVSYGAESYASLSADGSLSVEARLERLSALNAPGSWRWLQHHTLLAWDGVDEQWNLFVLGYDRDKQHSALQRLGVDSMSLVAGTTLTMAVVFTILAVVTAVMRAFNRGPVTTDDPVRRLYARFCRRLAKVAHVQHEDTEGPLDFARRASLALPQEASAIKTITELYVGARYAPASISDAPLAGLRKAVKNFRPRRPTN